MMNLLLLKVRYSDSLIYPISFKSPDFFPPSDYNNSNSTHLFKILILDSYLFKLREPA